MNQRRPQTANRKSKEPSQKRLRARLVLNERAPSAFFPPRQPRTHEPQSPPGHSVSHPVNNPPTLQATRHPAVPPPTYALPPPYRPPSLPTVPPLTQPPDSPICRPATLFFPSHSARHPATSKATLIFAPAKINVAFLVGICQWL